MTIRKAENNPHSNDLPPGMKEPALLAGVAESGYPLQSRIAAQLQKRMQVVEEWGFVDADTKESRTIDVFGYLRLAHEGMVATSLVLLVECKRSRHPLVFFQQVTGHRPPRFPTVSGIPDNDLYLKETKGGRMIRVPVSDALGLHEHAFVTPGPPLCRAFSRAEANGGTVTLSGVDPYKSIILPLGKAQQYELARSPKPSKGQVLWPAVVLCVGVIDAPMLLVEHPDMAADPIWTPWVRVLRHEAVPAILPGGADRFLTVDMVHADFFDTFVAEHAIPFALEFSARAEKREGLFRNGGHVPDIDTWKWTDVISGAAT